MATWSGKRRLIYGLIFVLAIMVFLGIPSFFYFHKSPTCFDGRKNGDETGIDCEGSCRKLCQSSFLPPKIEWGGAKFEKIAEGIYNVASYITNPNTNGVALNVPYKISLYDAKGNLIIVRSGSMTIPAHRNALAFESTVNTKDRIPAKGIFEFTKPPKWFKFDDNLEGLSIIDKKYQEDLKSSTLEVIFENKTLFSFKNIDVSAVLYDSDGNVIGFSKTHIDSISPKNSRETAIFTWPFSRGGTVSSIEIIPIITPIAD